MKSPLLCRFAAVSAGMVFLAGCTTFDVRDQQKIAADYYAGKLDAAADRADAISRKEAENSSENALLWHLEAGNVNLAAGRSGAAMQALNRAERLLYRFDSEERMQLHEPAKITYTGFLADRLLLHLLKGFLYLERGETEDFLVELRRMRASQFRYVLLDADPEIRSYEKRNRGSGVIPLRLQQSFRDGLKKTAFGESGLQERFQEYSSRRRPELSILFNPVGFYLSAVGYYFDNDWDEALVDMKYLAALDPGCTLFRRDRATLCKMLCDPLPDRTAPWKHDLGDQVVYVLYAEGHPPVWKNQNRSFQLPGQVRSFWNFSYPEYTPFAGGSVTAESGGECGTTEELADLGKILQEEFWQLYFSPMLDSLVSQTRAMTASHRTAQAALAAAYASGNDEWKSVRIAVAQAAVAATKNVRVDQLEWRRWSTVPRKFSVLHLPLGAPGNRTIRLQIRDKNGKIVETKSFQPGDDVNRVVIFIRELDASRYVRFWTSRE